MRIKVQDYKTGEDLTSRYTNWIRHLVESGLAIFLGDLFVADDGKRTKVEFMHINPSDNRAVLYVVSFDL